VLNACGKIIGNLRKIKRNAASRSNRDLRAGSEASPLLGLCVRIPPGHGCLYRASVMCCQVEVSATS
jgi:hypothetical protein